MAGGLAAQRSWPIWPKGRSDFRCSQARPAASPLIGPTAGYLFGFVGAAFVTGWLAERGWDRSVLWLFAAMALGHILILAAGFGWLALGMKLGVEKAWLVGIAPFIAASLIKNALGATLVPAIRRIFDRRD